MEEEPNGDYDTAQLYKWKMDLWNIDEAGIGCRLGCLLLYNSGRRLGKNVARGQITECGFDVTIKIQMRLFCRHFPWCLIP